MSTSRETVDAAKQRYANGESQEAYRHLRTFFSGLGVALCDEALFFEALALLATLSQAFGATTAADALRACLARRDDAERCFTAAWQLYEEGQYAPASALLFRANQLTPGEPGIVSELSAALEAQLRYSEAARVLEASGTPERDPMCAYLAGFNGVMCGELDRARVQLARLADVTDARLVFQRDVLRDMVARADALSAAGVSLTGLALSAWQAVINGTVLLHESPHGYEAPMRGRYAFVSDSPGLQREGLERLKAVLSAANAAPARIVSAPGRESWLLGLAASRVLGAPVTPWTPGAERGALVVAWSMEHVPDDAFLSALADHASGSRLFVHASSWVEPFSYAPDVTTLLHQTITHPYTGGALRVDPETNAVRPSEPDTRPDEALVEEVVTAPLTDPSKTTLEHVLAVTRALAGGGLFTDEGPRLRQRAGGPVLSSRFA